MRLSSNERKQQIIAEGIKIIHERGFPALSIRELANRVGISEPAIYRHFKNKEEIIMGILNKMQTFGDNIQQKLHTVDGELEKIKQLILFQLSYFEQNQGMTTIMLSEEIFYLNERLKRKLITITNVRSRILFNLIQSAQENNLIIKEDINNLTAIIMGSIRMLIFQWKLKNYKFSLTKQGQSVVNTLINMLTAKNEL